jgi:hypothetical protein
LSLDGRSIGATAVDENRYLDINQADPRRIDGVLQDHGYDASARTQLLGRIALARAGGHRIASYAEVAALGAGILAAGSEDCLLDVLSPFGGNGDAQAGPAAVRAGSIIRVTFGSGGQRRIQTLRLVVANDRPYALLDDYAPHCAGAGT